jgi:hypothetical protein
MKKQLHLANSPFKDETLANARPMQKLPHPAKDAAAWA